MRQREIQLGVIRGMCSGSRDEPESWVSGFSALAISDLGLLKSVPRIYWLVTRLRILERTLWLLAES